MGWIVIARYRFWTLQVWDRLVEGGGKKSLFSLQSQPPYLMKQLLLVQGCYSLVQLLQLLRSKRLEFQNRSKCFNLRLAVILPVMSSAYCESLHLAVHLIAGEGLAGPSWSYRGLRVLGRIGQPGARGRTKDLFSQVGPWIMSGKNVRACLAPLIRACTNKCFWSTSPVLHMQWSGFMNAHTILEG